jgi:hypothetical protein
MNKLKIKADENYNFFIVAKKAGVHLVPELV